VDRLLHGLVVHDFFLGKSRSRVSLHEMLTREEPNARLSCRGRLQGP
jgi:hypothetical protein